MKGYLIGESEKGWWKRDFYDFGVEIFLILKANLKMRRGCWVALSTATCVELDRRYTLFSSFDPKFQTLLYFLI